jgi:hypothetical protein
MTQDNTKDIFAEAEAEVAKEQAEKDKLAYKGQLRKVMAAREVLANEERALDVLKRSLSA